MPLYSFTCSHPACRGRGREFDRLLSLPLFATQKEQRYTGIHCPACGSAGRWIANVIKAAALPDIKPVIVDGSNRADPMELMGQTFGSRRELGEAKKKLGIIPAGADSAEPTPKRKPKPTRKAARR